MTLWPLLVYTCYRSFIAVKSLYPPLSLPRLMLSEKDDASLNAATSAPTTLSAQSIVQRTYEESFASIADRCPKDVNFRTCVVEISSEETNSTTSRPWWLQKMLNDATAGSGLWGPWHDLTSNTPSLRMCAIEKIGTKHWKKLFEALNADTACL